jgi:bacterioferritin
MVKEMTHSHGEVVSKLNTILEMEVSGLVRYLHYSLMITGPNRIPIVKWFQDQAQEAFQHAAIIGEKITALGGHPSLKVSPVPETTTHAVLEILRESLTFEMEALEHYKQVLKICGGDIALEDLIRDMIRTETEHVEEVQKMLAGS